MSYAIKIDQDDNVAVVTEEVNQGDLVTYKDIDLMEEEITAITPIPVYHKIALTDIPKNGKIIKYGEHIGEAACTIKAGEHVHTHNVTSVRENLKEK